MIESTPSRGLGTVWTQMEIDKFYSKLKQNIKK